MGGIKVTRSWHGGTVQPCHFPVLRFLTSLGGTFTCLAWCPHATSSWLKIYPFSSYLARY